MYFVSTALISRRRSFMPNFRHYEAGCSPPALAFRHGRSKRMDSMTERYPSKRFTKGAWAERYVDRFYRSRPGWIDGTTRFHTLCKQYVRKGARVCELGPGASNATTNFLSTFAGTLVGIDVDPRAVQN